MTMVPANTFCNKNSGGGYGGGGCGSSYEYNYIVGGGSDFPAVAKDSDSSMAEDESRCSSINDKENSTNNNGEEEEIREEDEGWLRLSIGGNTNSNTPAATRLNIHEDPTVVDRRTAGGGLVELDLLPNTSSSSTPVFHVPPRPVMAPGAAPGITSLFFQQQQQLQQAEAINWGFRPMPMPMTMQMQYSPHTTAAAATMAAASSSSPNSQTSSSPYLPLGAYFARPFHLGIDTGGVAGPSSSSDFRLIDPPRRAFSGIWFTLLASQNQAQEPFLPQISKSYLRIKDGRMTVRLLMKYLVNKLRLDSESEVEITCRGQQLLPFLTLQHVRDYIWSPRDAVTLLTDSSTIDHVMVLHYARSSHK
ncbi:protein LAX PANICLE 2-like isoform X2 [Euphorbia lathyris]|uniref:protein LAX PANICLE 2-like isoform X2 n=1 Tax=Euphorbia lathyris TaxID=212925 RepID=UPI0033133508